MGVLKPPPAKGRHPLAGGGTIQNPHTPSIKADRLKKNND